MKRKDESPTMRPGRTPPPHKEAKEGLRSVGKKRDEPASVHLVLWARLSLRSFTLRSSAQQHPNTKTKNPNHKTRPKTREVGHCVPFVHSFLLCSPSPAPCVSLGASLVPLHSFAAPRHKERRGEGLGVKEPRRNGMSSCVWSLRYGGS